jgi:hypothetical protein
MSQEREKLRLLLLRAEQSFYRTKPVSGVRADDRNVNNECWCRKATSLELAAEEMLTSD